MARVSRKLIVLGMVLALATVIALGVYFLLRREVDPTPYVAEGQQLMADGKYTEALLPLGRAHRIAGGQRHDVLAMIGECYLKMRPEPDYGKAAAYYRRAKQVATPDAPERVGYIVALRDLFSSRGAMSDALVEAEELTQLLPDDDEHWRELAWVCASSAVREPAAGQKEALFARAFKACGTAVAKGPANLDNYLLKQKLIVFMNDPDALEQAEAVINEAIEKADRKADAQVALGDLYRGRAEGVVAQPAERTRWLTAAAKAYNDALATDADNLAALSGLGQVAIYQEDFAQAETHFRQVLAKSPDEDRGYSYLARLLRARGELDEALKTVREAFAKCKPLEELTERQEIGYRFENLSIAATILVTQGKNEEAEQYVEQMKQLAPSNPTVFHLRGKIAFRQQDRTLAFEMFRKAVQMQEVEVRRAGSDVARQRAQSREGEYRFSLGAIYSVLNLPGKAVEEFDRALVLLERGNPLLRIQIRRERARTYLSLREYQKSESEAREVLKDFPKDFSTLHVLSRALLLQDKTAEALPVAQACIEVAPERYEGYLALALIHNRGEQVAAAEKSLLDGLAKASTKLPLYEVLISMYKQNDSLKDKLPGLVDRAMNDDGLTDSDKLIIQFRSAVTEQDRLKLLEDALAQDPENTVKLTNLARMLIQMDERDKALEYLRKAYGIALKADDMPQVRRLWDIVWVLLITSEDPEEARDWIGRLPAEMTRERRIAEGLLELISAVSLPAAEAEGSSLQGINQAKIDHADKAIQAFQRLLAELEGPPDVRLLRALARAHFLKGRLVTRERTREFTEAVKYHTQIISLVPQETQSRIDLATIYMSLSEPDRALGQVNEILGREPNNIEALNIKAEALRETGEHARALEVRSGIRTLKPENVANLMRMGLLYEFINDSDSALEVYRQAAEAAPESANVVLRLARTLYWKGQETRQEADALIETLATTIETNADKAENDAAKRAGKAAALLLRAQHYKETQRYDQAVALVQQAIAAGPANRGAVLFASGLMTEVNQYEQASQVCEDFLKTSPDDVAVTMQLCDVLMVAGTKLDRAEQLLTDVVLKADPASIRGRTILARVWAKMAVVARVGGDPDRAGALSAKAVRTLDEVLRDSPNFGEAILSRADLDYQQGNKRQAITVLGRIRRNDPVYGRAMQRRAQISVELGEQAQARSDLLNLLKADPRDIRGRIGLSELYIRANMLTDAEQVLKDGFRYMPDHPTLVEALITVLLRRQQLNEAITLADRLIELQPDNPNAWRSWYAAMKAVGKKQEALQKVQSAYQQHQDEAGFLFLIVDIYNAEELFDQSIALLRPALDKHPDGAALYLKLVDTMLAKLAKDKGGAAAGPEDVKPMETILGAGLQKTDNHWALRFKMAELCERTDRWPDAESWIRKVCDARPEFAMAWVRLGVSLLKQKRIDEAMAAFTKGVELDPTQFVAWNNMAWIAATVKKDLVAAKGYIGKARNLSPDHPDLLDTDGWVTYLSGDYQGAIELLERSLAKRPVPSTRYHLGMAYKGKLTRLSRSVDKIKAAKQAIEHLKTYLGGTPDEPEATEAQGALKELETTLKELENGS